MKIYPQLFKRTSTGDIQVWHMEVDGGKFRSISGKRGGKMVTSEWTLCEAKNVGKRNEISPADQALAEADAKYTKKRRQDFYDDLSQIDDQMRFKPMLAEPFTKVEERIPDEEILYFQPKLDGFRCVANKDGLWTREGLPIPTAPHVVRALAPLFARNPSLIFDGELYNHDLHDDFNQISSLLRKKDPTVAHLLRSEAVVQYHLYDMPSVDAPFKTRSNELNRMITELVTSADGDSTPLRLVETIEGKKEDALIYLEHFLKLKYEGAIARRNQAYENKRSKTLLKVKKFLDEEFQLVDLEEGRGNRAGMAARAILQLKDGRKFEAGMIGDFDYCRDLLLNKADYIGQLATVQFLNYTPGGTPRGGKLKTMRWA